MRRTNATHSSLGGFNSLTGDTAPISLSEETSMEGAALWKRMIADAGRRQAQSVAGSPQFQPSRALVANMRSHATSRAWPQLASLAFACAVGNGCANGDTTGYQAQSDGTGSAAGSGAQDTAILSSGSTLTSPSNLSSGSFNATASGSASAATAGVVSGATSGGPGGSSSGSASGVSVRRNASLGLPRKVSCESRA